VLKVVDLHPRHSIQTLVCCEHPLRILSRVVLAPDGKRLATTTIDGKTVKVWDLQRQKEAQVFPGMGLAFALGDLYLISMLGNSLIKLWDIQTGVELDAIDLEHALSKRTEADELSSFALTHNVHQAVVGGTNGSLYCFNLTETTP
jgi:WD40 repeat protein